MTLRDVFKMKRKPSKPIYVGTFFSPYRLIDVRGAGNDPKAKWPVIMTGSGGIEPMTWAADWDDEVFFDPKEAEADAYKNGWDGKRRNSRGIG